MGCDCGADKFWDGSLCVPDSPQKTAKAVTDVVELCEIENPLFDPDEECQKIID